jgi:hypothetical protein
MSPRRRGRGRGNGSGAALGVDVAAAPGSATAEVGAPRLDEGVAENRSQPVVAPANPAPRAGGGFAPNTGPGRGPNGPRGGDSRRPPRVNVPRVIAPNVIASSLEQDGGEPDAPVSPRTSTCTLAQMRRFIKSRPYVPVHELRRRFLIDGLEDEVSAIATGQRTLYVGLPPREAQFLGDLVRGGEVGCEMLLDPTSPGVVGVYPMRPVARQ